MIASTKRKDAEMDTPMTPPTLEIPPSLSATPIDTAILYLWCSVDVLDWQRVKLRDCHCYDYRRMAKREEETTS